MANVTLKGSIVQLEKDKPKSRCRKWQLRVPMGKSPRTGKYITKTRRVPGSYTEAEEALKEFVAELEDGAIQERTSWTFEEYSERYLKIREAKKEVAPSTIKKQRDQFKAVNAHLGKALLSEITPRILEDMYVAMLGGDTLSGRPSGGSYVNQIHDNIVLVFDFAMKEGILMSNPCSKAVPPKMDTKVKKALSLDLSNKFISELDPTKPNECAYLLAITLGLRRGEICGLCWQDVDFEQGLVNIVHSLDVFGNLKDTKTKAGTRILPLPDVTSSALRKQMVAQALQFAKTNSYRKVEEGYLEQKPDTPVITTHYGKYVQPGSLSRWWTRDRSQFGLDSYTLHELRHTYLTLLAQSNVHPKVMQELAGHYSCQITMDIYTHVNMEAKRKAVNAVSNIFPETKQPASLPGLGSAYVLGHETPIEVPNLLESQVLPV